MSVDFASTERASRPSAVCPAEHAGWLATPLRRLVTNPSCILRGLVRAGDTAVDLGCGPGFFTLPLADMVGDHGRVIAVDLQKAMLEKVGSAARRKGLEERIRLRQCEAHTLGLGSERADFALAFWMVHEVPDDSRFLAEAHALLRQGARLLIVEPWPHVGREAFSRTVHAAERAGFRALPGPRVALSFTAALERQ